MKPTDKIKNASARQGTIVLSTKDTYYLNGKTQQTGLNIIEFRGDICETLILFECAYL